MTLTVTDNDGETAETEQLLVVNQPQPNEIKVSGGGYIIVGGEKANFGFQIKKENAAFSGNLTYHDKVADLKVKLMTVTSLTVNNSKATFSGTCSVNKQPGYTFTVDVTDNGEPGRNDTFRIRLSNGYDAAGTLGGGNIKLHH